MAKRGRPSKTKTVEPVKITPKRGRPPKIPSPTSTSKPWETAFRLSKTVSDHYSMTPEEQELAFSLALTLKSRATIVELGVTHGRTAIILCYAAKLTGARYFGIDNFHTEGAKMLIDAQLAKLQLEGKIISGNTRDIAWDRTVDFLLIDAGHDELNMRQDIARWLPLVNPGGLVLFHAYNPQIEYGDPHYPVKYYTDEATKNWETITYIPYLLVKQKPI